MNDYKRFLMGCSYAVVKIKKHTDDLYNFVKLMESVGLKEDIEYFEKAVCDSRTREEKNKVPYCREMDFCEDYFFHIAEINGIKSNEVCIEYQIGNGFNFGKEEDYIDFSKKDDTDIKILNIKDLIIATGKESEFCIDYTSTSFLDELKDEKDYKLAVNLTDFCEWYGWELVKYPNGRYNIRDTEFTEDVFVGYFGNNDTETGTLKESIQRVFERMVDYGTNEEEYETVEDVEKTINTYIELGQKYGLIDTGYIEYLRNWEKEEKEFLRK